MRTGKRYIAAIAALLLVVPLAQMGGAAKKRQRVRSSLLAEGVNYTRILDRSGPFRIKVVDVDLSSSTTLDSILAKDRLPKFETTSSMAERTGAIAAINGDYARSSGRPVFAFAADGLLAQTALSWGRNFSTGFNESVTYIGHPQESVWVEEDAEGGAVLPVARVNHSVEDVPIASTEVRMFTWQGKKDAKPPAGHCSVRLQPSGEPLAQADWSGVRQTFVVETVACPGDRLHARGGVVLVSSLDSQYLLSLQGMAPGETVTASWSLGWGGVMDTIGGNPTLIEAGQIISSNVDGCGSFCGRHPRTGVGTTPDGRVLLVTVDGRQPKRSVGMSLREFAELFQSLGADWALNLDGGGSTTMVVGGRVTNRPSDKIKNEDDKWERVERAVSSALVLLPGADPDEQPAPSPAPSSSPSPGPSTSPSPSPATTAALAAETLVRALDLGWRFPSLGTNRSARRVVRDPASTGGMLDAMARRGYRLPAELRRILRSFRAR